jgi:hypothetical protein
MKQSKFSYKKVAINNNVSKKVNTRIIISTHIFYYPHLMKKENETQN